MNTIIVAIISSLGIAVPSIIATILTNKKDSVDTKIKNFSEKVDKELKWFKKSLEDEKKDRAKSDLVMLMSRIRNGYIPTVEEKMILYETKSKYNALGGNSYVDEMFNELKKEEKI